MRPICLSEHLYSPAHTTISTKEHELKHNPAHGVFFITLNKEADLHDAQQISLPAPLFWETATLSASVSPAAAVTDLSLNSHALSCSMLIFTFLWELQEKHLMLQRNFMSSERATADPGSVCDGRYKTVCVFQCVCGHEWICALIGCLTLLSLKCVSRALRSPNRPLQHKAVWVTRFTNTTDIH